MSNFTAYTISAIALIVIAAVLYAIIVGAWRVLNDDGQLRLERMLKRFGAHLEVQPTHAGAFQSAIAVRRCVACAEKPACDAWLASGRREGAEAFCPNAAFVQEIARAQTAPRAAVTP